MRRTTVHVTAVALALTACADARPPEVGEEAPEFTALALDGSEVHSDELRGAPWMLNIWATWCGPCRREMPDLQELHDTYRSEGFQVVGVSVDNRSATGAIRMFVADLDLEFPILHDPTAAIQDSYFLLGLPGTFLIDGDGVIARKWTGPFLPLADDVKADVEALLARRIQ